MMAELRDLKEDDLHYLDSLNDKLQQAVENLQERVQELETQVEDATEKHDDL